jgi:hypothetical protein
MGQSLYFPLGDPLIIETKAVLLESGINYPMNNGAKKTMTRKLPKI